MEPLTERCGALIAKRCRCSACCPYRLPSYPQLPAGQRWGRSFIERQYHRYAPAGALLQLHSGCDEPRSICTGLMVSWQLRPYNLVCWCFLASVLPASTGTVVCRFEDSDGGQQARCAPRIPLLPRESTSSIQARDEEGAVLWLF